MIANRRAHGATENAALKQVIAHKSEGNVAWLTRVKATQGLLLIGGASLGHFRIRVAQSHVRQDFLPSFWSMAAILTKPGRFATVPIDRIGGDAAKVVKDNAIVELPLRALDDPEQFPNIAALQFGGGAGAADLAAVRTDRSIVDLPSLVLPWLAFLWGTDQAVNPLLAGKGVPSAAFVESVYRLARIDLTPGLSSASSCPEAIWQSAKWWRAYYEQTSAPTTDPDDTPALPPHGSFTLRQPAAAVLD
jgi:hypothetical protein